MTIKNLVLIISLMFFATYEAKALTISPSPISNEISLSKTINYLSFSNQGSSSENLSFSLSQSGASIISNRCPAILKSSQSCYIIVAIDKNIIPAGLSSFPLKNNSIDLVTLKFNNVATYLNTSSFSTSSLVINDFVVRTVSMVNNTSSTKSYSPSFSGADASKFSILLNRCSNVLPNKTCSILFQLRPQVAGSYSASLTEPQSSNSISISSTISSLVALPPVAETLSVFPASVDLGSISRYGDRPPQIIIITNTGTTTLSPIIELSPNLKMDLNRCSSVKPQMQCGLTVHFRSIPSMSNGAISESISIKATALSAISVIPVTGTLSVASACTLANANLGGVNLNNVSGVSGTIPSCIVTSCDIMYSISNDAKYCQAVASNLAPGAFTVSYVKLNSASPPAATDSSSAPISNILTPSPASSTIYAAPVPTYGVIAPVASFGSVINAVTFVPDATSSSMTYKGVSEDDLATCSSGTLSLTSCIIDSIDFKKFTLNFVSNLIDSLSSNFFTVLSNIGDLTIFVEKYEITQMSNESSGSHDYPGSFATFNNALYMKLSKNGFSKLFKLDASGSLTQVSNTHSGGDDDPLYLKVFNNELLFNAQDSSGLYRLYKIDTSNNVTQLTNSCGAGNYPAEFTLYNSEMYFSMNASNCLNRLFKLNASGQLSQVSSVGSNDSPNGLYIYNNELYFTAKLSSTGSPNKLFKVSTSGQVYQVSNNRNLEYDRPGIFATMNNQIYLSLVDSGNGDRLWRLDSSGAISQVSTLRPFELILFNGSLYGALGSKVYKIDSSNQVTQIGDVNPGSADDAANFYIFNGELYFTANSDHFNRRKLFKINSSDQISRVSNTASGTSDIQGNPWFTQYKNELYFVGVNSSGYFKLFKLGPHSPVTQVSNTAGNSASDFPSELFVYNDELYFSAYSQASGNKAKLFKLKKLP